MEFLAASGRTPAALQLAVYAIVLVFAVIGHLTQGKRTTIARDVTGVRLHDLKVSEVSRCPVCGMTVEPVARAVCTACATPHHKECWRYNTGCATFACGERNYTL